MNVSQLINKYMASHRYKKLSDSSLRSYDYAIRKIEDKFGERDIKSLTRADFIRFQTELEGTPGASNLSTRVASAIFGFAVDMDYMPYNPVAGLKRLKGGSHEKWEPAEVRRAIAECDRTVSMAIALAWYTGQRESDILLMKWSDYEDGYIRIIQKKTGVEMNIKVHPDLAKILDAAKGEAVEYIVSGKKTMLSAPAFRNRFFWQMKKLGIYKTFHGIRKGVACSLAENGSSVNEIAAILGHKTLKMAAYYSEQANSKKMTESAVNNLTSCV